MKASEEYRQEIIRKLLTGANVHEIMGLAVREDEGASAYHLEMAGAMRTAAEMLRQRSE